MKVGGRRWLGTSDPYARLRKIESLDLATDYREITLLFYADFQSTMVVKSINGFMMNYASPRISRVLAGSGELEHRVAKRVVDTIMLASTVMQHGFTGEGRDAARRVNAMHSHYDIHPEDFLAVGSEEVVGSIELAERYGWRAVTSKEREAVNLYYSQQTQAFGSRDPLPATYLKTKLLYENYLNENVHYAPQNERLGKAITAFLATLAPVPIRSLYRMILLAQLDDRVARACGIRPASRPIKWMAQTLLRRMGRKDPIPDGAPNQLEALIRRVYPDGYRINRLGTHLR
jgi:ER-bound oxygenase mpaB/B'/Rubber oxygenase, catalytic domain